MWREAVLRASRAARRCVVLSTDAKQGPAISLPLRVPLRRRPGRLGLRGRSEEPLPSLIAALDADYATWGYAATIAV